MAMSSLPSKALHASRNTLESTPARALKLLRAVGTHADLRAAMATRGFGRTERDEGWRLLRETAAHDVATESPLGAKSDASLVEAAAYVRSFCATEVPVLRAALARHCPEHLDILPSERALRRPGSEGPTMLVLQILQRLEDLEKRPSTEVDAVVALLASRGLDRAAQERLARSVARVCGVPDEGGNAIHVEPEVTRAAYDASLRALYAWYDEWTAVARATCARKDQRIALGLAKRKPMKRRAAMATMLATS